MLRAKTDTRFRIFLRIFRTLGVTSSSGLVVSLFVILLSLMDLVGLALVGIGIFQFSDGARNSVTLFGFTISLNPALVVIMGGLFSLLKSLLYFRVVNFTSIRAHEKVLKRTSDSAYGYIHTRIEFFDQIDQNRVSENFRLFANGMQGSYVSAHLLMGEILYTSIIAVIFLVFEPFLALGVITVIATFIFITSRTMKNLVLKANKLLNSGNQRLTTAINLSIRLRREIYLYKLDVHALHLIAKPIDSLSKGLQYQVKGSNMPKLFADSLISLIWISLGLFFLTTANDNLDFSNIILYSIVLIRLFPTVLRIQNLSLMFNSSMDQLITANVEIERFTKKTNFYSNPQDKSNTNYFGKSTEIVLLRNVAYRYDGTNGYVFSNVDLSLKRRESIAIIGDNGVGKSTLLEIIAGLRVPVAGTVDFSKDLKIGLASSQSFIFPGTLLENVTLLPPGEGDSSRVDFLLQNVGLGEVIERNELRLNQELTDFGQNLSAGQKQRLAIARAIYQNPDVMLLDETTSAIDKKGEARLLEFLRSSLVNSAVVHITHDIKLAMGYERQYVLSKKGLEILKG